MTLFQESGGTPADRSEEARKILRKMGLSNATAAMTDREAKFVNDMTARFEEYGLNAGVSVKQLFWLRDLKDRYLT